MRNKIRRLEAERAPRHESDLETITNARSRPQIAVASRLTAQLIMTRELTAPEGRAIPYALQLSLSALRSNDDKTRRRLMLATAAAKLVIAAILAGLTAEHPSRKQDGQAAGDRHH